MTRDDARPAMGMDKASMAQIASHCNVSKALLYHSCPSRDVLIFAIIHGHLVAVEASVAAAVDEAVERQIVRQVARVLRRDPPGASTTPGGRS